jgi:hypothetical protein
VSKMLKHVNNYLDKKICEREVIVGKVCIEKRKWHKKLRTPMKT